MVILSSRKSPCPNFLLRTAATENRAHSIVFSSWVRMLHLVGIALKEANITAIQYNGTLSVSEKQKVLSDFQSSNRVTVLLMSIGSGGVG